MTEFFHKVNYWKLAIFKVVNGCILVAAAGWISSTNSVDWASLHWNEKVIIALSVYITVGKFIDGFLDNTMSRLRNGGHQ